MKKKILFAALAIAILALFAGCDAILEGFFPEFSTYSNFIIVDYEASSSPVAMALLPYDDGGTNIEADKIILIRRPEKVFSVSFDGLPAGKYEVFAWHDVNDDGKANDGNGRLANILGSSVTEFTFPEFSDESFFTGECNLTAGTPNAPPPELQ